MKALNKYGFGEFTYLIEDNDLPFEITTNSENRTLAEVKQPKPKKEISNHEIQKTSEIETILQRLTTELKKKKVQLLRWDASENTSYLKMDWGVLSTIRISTELGSPTYSCKYTILIGADSGNVSVSNGLIREFYTPSELNELLNSIEIEREEKIHKYGPLNYQKYILENQKKAKSQKGFFEHARKV